MNQQITYYGAFPLMGDTPTAVFRFFTDGAKLPERYVANSGWVEDHRLLLKKISGDLGPADLITEQLALKIIQDIQSKNGNNT